MTIMLVLSKVVICIGLIQFSSCLHCGPLSPYDSMCTVENNTLLDNTVFILSSKPCESKSMVTLTIMNTGSNGYFFNISTERNLNKVISIGNGSKVGISVDFHRENNRVDLTDKMHASIYWFKVFKNGSRDGLDHYLILESYFIMAPSVCQKFKVADTYKSTGQPLKVPYFKKQSYCTDSRKLGDFSTLCFKQSNAIYVTIFNPCDVPYSVTIVILLPHTKLEIIKKLTSSLTSTIPIKALGTLGGEQRVSFEKTPVGQYHERQKVVLKHVYESNNKSETLIDDQYFTLYGMICPLSSCKKVRSDTQSCKVNYISSETDFNDYNITLKLDVCTTPPNADVKINLSGYPDSTFSDIMKSSPHFTVPDANRKNFTFTTNKHLLTSSGFIPTIGGEISLHVKEMTNMNMFHVMLLRHSPTYQDSFPILHSNFYLSKQKICVHHSTHSASSVKIIIPIVCVVLLFLLVILVVWCWKKRKNRSAGLPYQIELGMDDDDDHLDDL